MDVTGDAATWVSAALAAGALWLGVQAGARAQRREAQEQHTTVMAEIKAGREASEVGRARLYERIGQVERDIRETHVSRPEHMADIRVVTHSVEELVAQHADLAFRLAQECPGQRRRRLTRLPSDPAS